MRLTYLFGPVLFTLSACGPGAPPEGDTDASTGTTGGATASTTGPQVTTGDPMVTTTAPATTSTGPAPATSTTGPLPTTDAITTDVATTSTVTTDATTGPDPVVGYLAMFGAGGLDHLFVRKANFSADLCTEIAFARPGDVPHPGLQLPEQWFYQGARIYQGAGTCHDLMGPQPGPFVNAEVAAGLATWDTQPFCPEFLDLDITLTFPPDLPWVPAEDVLHVDALFVVGC